MNDLQTVILVGGKGTRLKALTENIPKPMIPVQGRPFLEVLIKLLKSKGLSRFLLLTGYLQRSISEYFGNGERFGINIEYSIEPELLGTAGALLNAQKLLEKEFLLINGDTFSDVNYAKFVKFSRDRDNVCSMLCYNGPLFNDVKYNLILEEDNLVTYYSKDSSDNRLNAVDAGVYLMKKDIISVIRNRICSLEAEIFPVLISSKQLCGLATQTMFYDIGTIERLAGFRKLHLFPERI
jgi:NDP-sugar pyrophosphorylase family protein